MHVLLFSLAGLWGQWIGPVLLFVVGLGLVVFVHELGHFIVAKRVGIKVERFALGMGPRVFGVKVGETDYCLCLLPLGGYVKMLGQEDFAPLKRPDELDPRSFEAKSIGARFAVISAGVIMNVIFASVLFIVVGMVGIDFPAPVVGGVIPGYPAASVELDWQPAAATQPAAQPASQRVGRAQFGPGLRPGDRLLEVDSSRITRFPDMTVKAALASQASATFRLVVAREDQGGRRWIGTGTIGVKRSPDGRMPIFGLIGPQSTVFDEYADVKVDSPYRKGDRLLAIDGRAIRNHWDIAAIEPSLDGKAVKVTIQRDGRRVDFLHQPVLRTRHDVVWLADGKAGRIVETVAKDDQTAYRLVLADGSETEVLEEAIAGGGTVENLDILGMLPRLKVSSVTKGSRADKAGILPGDIIVGYGDHGAPTMRQLLAINERALKTGTEMAVLRDGEQLTMKVAPKLMPVAGRRGKRAQIGISNGPDLMHAVLAAVREGSPAEKAGLQAGDVIEEINGQATGNWIDVFNALKQSIGRQVEVSYRRGAQTRAATMGVIDRTSFDPGDYEITIFDIEVFEPLMVTIHKTNPLDAVVWGAGETWDFIVRAYATLRSLLKKTVSTEALSGPVGIARIAVQVGREQSLVYFVYFMAFISATIAVINFLPVPVVDGGHAVFLLLEKIRGKPLPTKVMNISQFVGLGLILLIFVLLTWQDIARWVGGLW